MEIHEWHHGIIFGLECQHLCDGVVDKMNNVIVFGGGSRNTLGVIRSLGIKGIPVILLLKAAREDRGGLSRYVVKVHFFDKEEEALGILRDEYCGTGSKAILFCTSDAAICLMDRHYNEMKEHFFIYNARGEQGRINYFVDKINTFPLADKSGFSVIKTWHVNDIHNVPHDITYPCLTKGNNSSRCTKSVMHVCNSRGELCACLQEGVDYLIQEYIKKEYEINIVGFSYNHGKNVYAPAVVRKIRDDIGRQSVYIRLDDIRDYPNLNVKSISTLVQSIGYEGMFSIELIYSGGKYYFLEINLRSDDCTWLYTVAGINYPYLWVKYTSGEIDAGYIQSIKFRTPFHLMALNDIYNLLEHKVSFFRWAKECLTADAHFFLYYRDLGPYFSGMGIHFRQFFKKCWRKIKRSR